MNVVEKLSTIGRSSQTPHTLIIHAMSEILDGQHASDFLNKIGLSAHYLIEPDGTITKMRKTNQGAYHAKGHNTNTIGIEVLVEGEHTYDTFLAKIKTDWVNPAQMEALVELTDDITGYWDIKKVTRHSDIDPSRKKDPGTGFNWDEYLDKIKFGK